MMETAGKKTERRLNLQDVYNKRNINAQFLHCSAYYVKYVFGSSFHAATQVSVRSSEL